MSSILELNQKEFLKTVLLSQNAKTPIRNLNGAGLDLFTAEDALIPQFSNLIIKTDIAIEIPEGFVGLIKGRSGVSFKHNIIIHNGVIDANYRGNLGILVHNLNTKKIEIKKGKRIAQILIIPIITPKILIVQNISETDRGTKGFGSSDLPENLPPSDSQV